MTTYLLLILLSLLVLHGILRYNKSARAINKIPGPISLPFIGNMLQMNVSAEELWLRFRHYSKEYYPTFKAWFTVKALIFIRHPDDVKILLLCKKNINKSSFYDNLAEFGGDGIILSKDDKWRQRRKIMNPAFSPTLLQNHMKVTNQYITNLMMHIKSEADETIQELLSLFGKLTFEIICESTMGVDVSKAESEGGEKYRHGLEVICNITLFRVVRPYIKDWMMNWLPSGWKLHHAIRDIRTFRNKVIAERRKYLEQTDSTMNKYTISNGKTDDGYNGRNRKKPLLDILLSAEKEGVIDRQGVAEEVDNLIAAGYDTTSLALCYTVMLLAENKKAQDIARAEIFEVCNQVGGKITTSEVQKFEYLDRCVKESLRLFPIAPHIGRGITESLQLRDYYIPAGTEVILNIFDLHRDPNFWPEPEKFDPDRFLPEQVENRHPFAYVPFSGGVRNCIGQKYAMMTLKTVIAYILYNFYLEPIDRTSSLRQFSLSVALYPGRPIRTKFIKIKKI